MEVSSEDKFEHVCNWLKVLAERNTIYQDEIRTLKQQNSEMHRTIKSLEKRKKDLEKEDLQEESVAESVLDVNDKSLEQALQELAIEKMKLERSRHNSLEWQKQAHRMRMVLRLNTVAMISNLKKIRDNVSQPSDDKLTSENIARRMISKMELWLQESFPNTKKITKSF